MKTGADNEQVDKPSAIGESSTMLEAACKANCVLPIPAGPDQGNEAMLGKQILDLS